MVGLLQGFSLRFFEILSITAEVRIYYAAKLPDRNSFRSFAHNQDKVAWNKNQDKEKKRKLKPITETNRKTPSNNVEILNTIEWFVEEIYWTVIAPACRWDKYLDSQIIPGQISDAKFSSILPFSLFLIRQNYREIGASQANGRYCNGNGFNFSRFFSALRLVSSWGFFGNAVPGYSIARFYQGTSYWWNSYKRIE